MSSNSQNAKKLKPEQQRMFDAVDSLQKYMATYDKQPMYLDYREKTFIDDVLYGLGVALSQKYCFAGGFERFKGFLRKHLGQQDGPSGVTAPGGWSGETWAAWLRDRASQFDPYTTGATFEGLAAWMERLPQPEAGAERSALEQILNIEKHADGLRGSGMVDDVDMKAMRAMATVARKALYHQPDATPDDGK